MRDYNGLEARTEPLEWDRATYTILRLPQAETDILRQKGKKRAGGKINEYPVNLGTAKAEFGDGTVLRIGKPPLKLVGISAEYLVEMRRRAAKRIGKLSDKRANPS